MYNFMYNLFRINAFKFHPPHCFCIQLSVKKLLTFVLKTVYKVYGDG